MKRFGPSTLREFREMERLAAYGFSNLEVIKRMREEHRHSELIYFKGDRYCTCCSQIITLNECLNCGQTIPKGGF